MGKLSLLLACFFTFVICYAESQIDMHPFSSQAEANRFLALTKEIRCVVCQNQTIAESTAPLAHDLREKIYQMLAAKQSDEVIKNYLVKRYGEFILFKPPFNKFTAALWCFPFAAILLAVIFLSLHRIFGR